MSCILVPYHLDEHQPGLDVPVEPDAVITVELPEGDTWRRMTELYQQVADAVADDVRAGRRSTVLSADCTTSLGTVAGLQRAGLDPAVVWFDGHGDVQSLETTTSGYLGGFPLRILVGYRPELIANSLALRAVEERRVVLVDARDLDPPEIEFLRSSAITRRGVSDFAAAGEPAAVVPEGPIYLHLDFDVVDPSELPGLVFPTAGGPGLDVLFAAVQRIMETGRVAAFGVGCTWHPGQRTAERIGPRLADVIAR